MLLGERVYLRLMEESDVPYKVNWINDSKVRRTLNFDFPVSEVATKKWLHKVSALDNRKDFIVCLKTNNVPIGYGGLLNIDRRNSKAESYMAIGNKEYWGKGYAKEIRKIILEYAFIELGLNRIYSYVWSENVKMISLNKKIGFQIEGTLKQDVFSHGEYRDRVIMGITSNKYLNNKYLE